MPTIEVSARTYADLQALAEPFLGTADDVIQTLVASARRSDPRHPDAGRVPAGKRTPNSAFYEPILRVLRHAGGELPTAVTLDRVGHLMDPLLTETDRAKLCSGEIRWRNTARFARYDLVCSGKLDAHSPHGVWRLATGNGVRLVANRIQAPTRSISMPFARTTIDSPGAGDGSGLLRSSKGCG